MDTIIELRSHLAEVKDELTQIDADHQGDLLPADVQERWNALQVEMSETEKRILHLEERAAYLETIKDDPARTEVGSDRGPAVRVSSDPFDLTTIRASAADPEQMGRELCERANRVVEQLRFGDERVNREAAQQHVSELLEGGHGMDDPAGLALHMLRTSSPTYMRAFSKAIAGRPLSTEEARALSTAGSAGGYAVPFTLDPTVILSSDGVVNPMRQISRVITIVGETWKGVTSQGITVSRSAEAAAVNPTAPTLAQPEITPTRVAAEIDYSVEIGEDWGALQSEMARLLADAKDVEEADMFINGLGPDTAGYEPAGVVKTLSSGSEVASGSTSTFGIEDVYALLDALPPRFQSRASWLAHRAIFSEIRQFDTYGGSATKVLAPLADGRPGLLELPRYVASEMDGVIANGAKVLLVGDFSQYAIVDRVGMTVELDPHVRDGNGKWTGQRALLAYWRNSAAILVDNAFRVLVIETS